ncbi:hypothetical protein ACFL0W_00470 [Nanoarchaeota archaeon]
MAWYSIILSILGWIWVLFKDWIVIFIAPAKNWHMIWIIVPIWLTWFFAEFFQEKKGTSFGNAISNGGIAMWVGIDWTRYLVNSIIAKELVFNLNTFLKFLFALLVLSYGFMVIIYGIKTKKFIHYAGRIRTVSYFLLMFSPIIYGVLDINLYNIAAIFIFFPLFYGVIELIDKYTPNPKTYDAEDRDEGINRDSGGLGDLGSESSSSLGSEKGKDDFGDLGDLGDLKL